MVWCSLNKQQYGVRETERRMRTRWREGVRRNSEKLECE